MSKSRGISQRLHPAVTARIHEIRRQIARVDHITSGTLHRRMKVCGKPNCRCAADPKARHGPYYEWSWLEAGRLVHRLITREQATLVLRAIGNYKRLKRLLAKWDEESSRLILDPGAALVARGSTKKS